MSSENKSELFPIRPEYFDYLEKDLKDLFRTVSGDEQKISELTDLLISKYSEKHRAYHNLSHVFNLIHNAADSETKIEDDETFRLAIWFHDAIYEPQSKTNEIESAALAVEYLPNLICRNPKLKRSKR